MRQEIGSEVNILEVLKAIPSPTRDILSQGLEVEFKSINNVLSEFYQVRCTGNYFPMFVFQQTI